MLTRHITEVLKKRFHLARSLYLFGARQVGKTTLLKQTFPELPYRSLEDPDQEQAALADPKGFLSQFSETGAILDELQRVPDLFRYLQSHIDEYGTKFLLSGSQNFLMNQHITQSLAGRISILELLPLSQRELWGAPLSSSIFCEDSLKPDFPHRLNTRLHQGGYPEPATKPEIIEFWFADYERTYLERDVRQLINVTNLQKFSQFLRMVAHRVGSLLNIANLANDVGMSETSCRQWLSILEASGVVFRLQPHHQNFNKRLVKSPKLYFSDTGLLCYLLGITEKSLNENQSASGGIFENYVITEIRKGFLNQGKPAPLYFWRDKNGTEVDLLIETNNHLEAIEIKKGGNFSENWLTALRKWSKWSNTPLHRCSVVYGGAAYEDISGVSVRPWFMV